MSLKKNDPLKINKFGRNQIFVCASFNDWVPQEMKTFFEIETQKKFETDEKLFEFLTKKKESDVDD